MIEQRQPTAMYNNDSLLLTFNKFRGKKLRDIPAWYLLRLHDEATHSDLSLKEWIGKNYEHLQEEKRLGIDPSREYVKEPGDSFEQKRKFRKQFSHKPLQSRPGDVI